MTTAGIAVPVCALAGVPLLGPAWISGLPLLLFNPVDLAGPLPVDWGCSGPSGPPETKELGLIVLIAASLWSVSVLTVPSIALLTYVAGTSTDPKAMRLARTYALTSQLALLSYFGAMWGTLQAFASR